MLRRRGEGSVWGWGGVGVGVGARDSDKTVSSSSSSVSHSRSAVHEHAVEPRLDLKDLGEHLRELLLRRVAWVHDIVDRPWSSLPCRG